MDQPRRTGRPRKRRGEKMEAISITIPVEQLEIIDKEDEARGFSQRSNILREAISLWIRVYKNGETVSPERRHDSYEEEYERIYGYDSEV